LELGAYSYITKPFNIGEVSFIVNRAAAFRKLVQANKELMVNLENQNVQLDKMVQEKTRELALLYEIAQEISASLNLEETLKIITNKVTSVLEIEICSILLYDKKTERLSVAASKGLNTDAVKETSLQKGERISGWVFENKEALFVPNIEDDDRFKARNNENYYTNSFISVPLIFKDSVIGVLNVNNKRSKDSLTEDDFRLIKGIAREAAIAIENARLYSDLKKTYMNTILALTSTIDAERPLY
jgi:phosphoserine phosphatase RsbU/P